MNLGKILSVFIRECILLYGMLTSHQIHILKIKLNSQALKFVFFLNCCKFNVILIINKHNNNKLKRKRQELGIIKYTLINIHIHCVSNS